MPNLFLEVTLFGHIDNLIVLFVHLFIITWENPLKSSQMFILPLVPLLLSLPNHLLPLLPLINMSFSGQKPLLIILLTPIVQLVLLLGIYIQQNQ